MTETDNIITVPGGRIWSQIISSSKKGAPIIFLHGGPGSTHDKLKWGLKPLSEYCPLIFYDQLGSGNSVLPLAELENNNLWQVPRFVAELEDLIEFYQLDEFHLYGTSWGATLAMEYLLTAKNPKAKSVIFSSPMLNCKMWIDDANYLKQQLPDDVYKSMLKCEAAGTTGSQEYIRACEYFDNQHCLRPELLNSEQLKLIEAIKDKFNSYAYLSMWGPSEFFANGSLLGYDRYNDLSKIKIPTMFLCGEFDEAMPGTVMKFHQKVANSKYHVFKNCSHQAYFEDSREFIKIVGCFINQVNALD